MTKREREKMHSRFHREFGGMCFNDALTCLLRDFVAREVTRAVKAERKAWQDAEELRLALMQRTAEQISERAKKGKSR